MKLLVLGANGLLGSAVVATAGRRGLDVAGTYHSAPPDIEGSFRELDLRDHDRIETVIDAVAPDAVVNCAAMTDVDGCESAVEDARTINGAAPGVIARACASRDLAVVHVSTDYVFDGRTAEGYDEEATTNPIQVYGRTKLEGERAVRDHHPTPLVVRPSFVYGIHRGRDELTGFPAWVRDRLESGDRVPLFADQHVTPSRAGMLAETMLDLLAAGATGTFHVACQDCVTPFEFGRLIADRLGAERRLLERTSIEDVERPAARPPHTCLDTSKVEEQLMQPLPTLEEDLAALADYLPES